MNSITFARFAGERTLAVASYLWQWDYGQVLKIEGLELPTEYEVHFSNTSETGTTTTVLGDKNGVNIPDALLETGNPIFAFIYLHDLETDGETEYKIKIPVRKRPHPDRPEPSPEQTDLITQAITALNQAVERTDASAEEAGEAAELAQQAAGSAAGYAQQAAESAQEARDAADGMDAIAQTAVQARDEAVTASQTATAAKIAAQEAAASVEEHVYDVEEYARQAAQSASDAGQSASAASQSATSAGASAQAATAKAQEASDSASGALASAGAASDSATQAGTKATEAAQSASAASGSASSAAQSASDASDEADRAETAASSVSAAAAQIAINTADITDLKADLTKKADLDGYYEDMTVGDAEQLVSTQYYEDATPYNYRTTGGSADVGNREYVDAVVGGTVVWNQLVSGIREDSTAQGLTFVGSGTFTSKITGTGIGGIARVSKNVSINFVKGHKYFASWGDSTLPNGTLIVFGNNQSRGFVNCNGKTASVGVCTESNSLYLGLQTVVAEYDNTLTISLHDITQMFGSTIADYIYSLEQATAGAGVAYFRKLFPKDYYEYNAGELKSVSGLVSHDMTGFNLWDEEWENGTYDSSTGEKQANAGLNRSKNRIPVLPSTQYYIKRNRGSSRVFYYDFAGNYIDSYYHDQLDFLFTTPANCHYITFAIVTSVWSDDICINLSWSGTRNGEYEPYQKHSYTLDSTLTLRGIPKLDSNNNLYYDGDKYLPDGTVERRYGIVDLGTLTWVYHSSGNIYANNAIPNRAVNGDKICGKYTYATLENGSEMSQVSALTTDKAYAFQYNLSTRIIVRDSSYTDASTFKAAMSGVMLVYELATPTIETADPYQKVQICDDWGTEEYVTDSTASVLVPVGHKTRYPANLRDKLQHLPNLADADGYYMINQNGSQMTLEHFRIPKVPTTDGTYTLRATVSGGTPTYSWESES